MIRTATVDDIAALLVLEQAGFATDRISRRSFRHLLSTANALTLLEQEQNQVRGYLILLFRRNTRMARVYSIATATPHRVPGLATALLQAAEQAAVKEGCSSIRLEIRLDNHRSLQFFQRHGYRIFGQFNAYYADQMTAARLEKPLPPLPSVFPVQPDHTPGLNPSHYHHVKRPIDCPTKFQPGCQACCPAKLHPRTAAGKADASRVSQTRCASGAGGSG